MFGIVNPLPGYMASDTDASANPAYYGFVDHAGKWYIMQQTTTGSAVAYRFAAGNADYADAWTARAAQTYVLFSELL